MISFIAARCCSAFSPARARAGSALAQSKEPILIGITGPLTGQYAQYGAQWKKGFDVALDEINGAGGINGRPLAYVFEDSQSDPRQTVTIARKYVADERIVVEVGDFSCAASMAASPIYQAAGLVQFGFSNSHPDFTKGGDYVWSNAVNQKDEMPLLADFLRDLGLKKIAILHLNSDWGRTAKDLLVEAVKQRGGEVTGSEGYLADEKDFRSAIVRLRGGQSGFDRADLLLSGWRAAHAPDPPGRHHAADRRRRFDLFAEIPRAWRRLGERRAHHGAVLPRRSAPAGAGLREEVRREVQRAARRLQRPRLRHLILLCAVMRQFGTDRKAIKEGLGKIKDVPSVVFGKVAFDTATRRVADPLVAASR